MLRNNHNREFRLIDSVSINIPSLESHSSGKCPKTEQTSCKVKFERNGLKNQSFCETWSGPKWA